MLDDEEFIVLYDANKPVNADCRFRNNGSNVSWTSVDLYVVIL